MNAAFKRPQMLLPGSAASVAGGSIAMGPVFWNSGCVIQCVTTICSLLTLLPIRIGADLELSAIILSLAKLVKRVPIVGSMETCRHADAESAHRVVAGLALCLTLLTAVGCASKKIAPPAPPPLDLSIVGDSDSRLQESLFKGDQAVLSNQDIDRILTARITLADRHRLVVLRLNARNIWVQEIAGLETQNSEQFQKALAKTPQFTQVRFMPTLLIPERRTVPYLREAAARFQADLILVYGTRVKTFQRDRLIGTDEVHAEAVVESVLLDVRTGIVIHASQATESISAKKSPGDLNFSQTIMKAQTEATRKALLKLADTVVAFAATTK